MEMHNSVVIIALVLLGAYAAVAQAQDVEATSAATLAVEANPEGVFLRSAASTAALPGAPAPTARLSRNTRLQAATALNNATMVVLKPADFPAEISQQVVCGANSLTPTNFNVYCRIISTFPNGQAASCSAAKVGVNRLSTAGHCVYYKELGGWAKTIDVYCTGQQACGVARTTTVTHSVTTSRWFASTSSTLPEWDVAVLRTYSTLPGTSVTTGAYTATGIKKARLTGYTGSRAGVNGCSGYNGCTQYSSTDSMLVTSSGYYTSNTMDLCVGNSGGAVVDAASNIMVAVVAVEVTRDDGQCVENRFAPLVLEKNVDEAGCTRSTGGASIPCLSSKLPA